MLLTATSSHLDWQEDDSILILCPLSPSLNTLKVRPILVSIDTHFSIGANT